MKAPINATTPVIIGQSAINQRLINPEKPEEGKDAADLMVEAAKGAAGYLSNPDDLSQVDAISVCQGMWPYNNPAGLIKSAIHATKASTRFQKIGVLQQDLISQACLDIQQGKHNFCLIAGGEAKYRDLLASIHGVKLPEKPMQTEADIVVEPLQELWLEAETNAGLGMPVGYYALMDSAYQSHFAIDGKNHREAVARLYHRFSQVAAENPDAWKKAAVPANEIEYPSEKNPMLAFPYTKRHNSSWNVDQASAILICSTEKALALGVDPKHWTFPLVSTASNHMLSVSERKHLGTCPGAEEAARALYQASSLTPDDLDLVELYSCFPVGVLSFAKALKLGDRMDLTTTGGMPFAGGPLNNYVLQSTVKTLKTLKASNKKHALVSNISGMNTKQGLFLYGTSFRPFQHLDVSKKTEQVQSKRTVDAAFQGKAIIVASTVLFQKNRAERAVIIAENDQGIRAVAYSTDSNVIDAFQRTPTVGKSVEIDNGSFYIRP